MIATTSAVPDNSWPVIDSPDVIARIEQLKSWMEEPAMDWPGFSEMEDELYELVLLDDAVRASAKDWRNTKLYRYDNPDRFTVPAPYQAYFEGVAYFFA